MLRSFINDALVIELGQSIKIRTADIRRAHHIKLPDAIIAATAIVYGLTIISRNVGDFKKIDGLVCINPWDL